MSSNESNIFDFNKIRRKSSVIRVGSVYIGGTSRISIQTMTTTETSDIDGTSKQINQLANAGCDIIRVTVNNLRAAKALKEIKNNINIPLIADVHFDHRLALEAIKNDVDCLRLNPGNITDKNNIANIILRAKEKNIPIRVGVNSGSIDLKKYPNVTPYNLVQSALDHIKIIESYDYYNIKVSVKSTDINFTIKSYEILAGLCKYPLHLGVTEAGTLLTGSIKSSVALGSLLLKGIGDTIRISLSASPLEEVKVAKYLLRYLGIRKEGVNIISCPTCGRCNIDVFKISKTLEDNLSNYKKSLKVAVIGCVVNGPGESINSDIGISGGLHKSDLYIKGNKIGKINNKDIIKTVIEEAKKFE